MDFVIKLDVQLSIYWLHVIVSYKIGRSCVNYEELKKQATDLVAFVSEVDYVTIRVENYSKNVITEQQKVVVC